MRISVRGSLAININYMIPLHYMSSETDALLQWLDPRNIRSVGCSPAPSQEAEFVHCLVVYQLGTEANQKMPGYLGSHRGECALVSLFLGSMLQFSI